MSEPRPTPVAEGQETIRMITGDYLAHLRRLVNDGRARHDPTLAVAISIEALAALVEEVERARESVR